ncbi:MAG TPA: hypothetical protein VHY18_12355 [Solirubrobacteraceae bacterium]|nr:hypothetical protein [Solirubrobacteraceae bacterium]
MIARRRTTTPLAAVTRRRATPLTAVGRPQLSDLGRSGSGLPVWRPRLHRALLCGALAACALALASCANTLQDQPIGPQPLESVLVKSRFPVYWLGLSFHGMQITSVAIDPSEAVTIRYGDCVLGGQYTCVTPVSIVTSPDNSFVPGGSGVRQTIPLRGVSANSAQAGSTLAIATGKVVVSVFGKQPTLAREAAETMAPLNTTGLPLAALPAALPDSGYGRTPLSIQVPAGVSVPRGPGA